MDKHDKIYKMKRPKPPELEPLQQLGVVPMNYDTYVKELEEYIDHLESKAENLPISNAVGQSEELPDFLYEDNGEIKIGSYADTVVTNEWNNWKKGNCQHPPKSHVITGEIRFCEDCMKVLQTNC